MRRPPGSSGAPPVSFTTIARAAFATRPATRALRTSSCRRDVVKTDRYTPPIEDESTIFVIKPTGCAVPVDANMPATNLQHAGKAAQDG